MIALEVAIDPDVEPQPGFDGREAISLAVPDGDGWRDLTLLYLVTPELLEQQRLNPDTVEPKTEFLTAEPGELRIQGVTSPAALTNVERIPPGYTSPLGSFITPDALRRRGWEAAGSGRWLVETAQPLTGDQLATARDVAAGGGLTIESRDHQEGLLNLRTVTAATAGALAGLSVTLGTVGAYIALTAGVPARRSHRIRGDSARVHRRR